MTSASPTIFIIEDESLIAMELTDRLVELGYRIAGVASRGEDALKRMSETLPDLALIDINLAGQIDGIETAALLRKQGDTAVVFLTAFSDSILLERAGQTEPLGYLIKPFEERELHATIQTALYRQKMERSLREANSRLDEKVHSRTAALAVAIEQLARSESELRAIWNTTDQAMRVTDIEGIICRINPAFCRLFGRDESDLVGQPMHCIYNPGNEAHYLMEHRNRFSADLGVIEAQLDVVNHPPIWVEISHRVLPSSAGVPALLLTTFRDITSRKSAEVSLRESEEDLVITLDSIGDGVLTADKDGRITRLNPVAESLTGWNVANAIGRTVAEVFKTVHDTACDANVVVEDILRTGILVKLTKETVLIARDGIKRHIAYSAAPIRDRGDNVRGVVLVFRDQTRERYVQQEIREREQLLTSIHQNLVGSFVYRVQLSAAGDMSFRYISPNVEEITGLKPAGLLADGERFKSLLLATDTPQLLERIASALATGDSLDAEVRLMHALDRGLRWLRLRGRLIEHGTDGTGVYEGIAIDITAAKEAEAENRKLALIAERTINGVVLTDRDSHIEWVNPGFTRVTGYTLNEVRGRIPGKFLQGPDTDQSVVRRVGAALRSGQGTHAELLNYKKDGQKYWVEIEIQPLHDANGILTHFMAIEKDITERKIAEEALAESERRFSALFMRDPVATCLSDFATGELLDANERFVELFGRSRDQLLAQATFEVDPWGDDSAAHAAFAAKLSSDSRVIGVDRSVRLPGGGLVEVTQAAHLVELSGRQCVLNTFVDITERKAAENEVRRLNTNLETQVRQRTETLALSEERFRRLAENMRDLLCMIDESSRFAYVSPSFNSVLNYPVEELLGLDALVAVHPDDVSRVSTLLREVLVGGTPVSYEFRFRHKQGHFVWLEANSSVVRSPEGTVRGCVTTARDITDRRVAAIQLRESEQRYAQLVENVNDAIIRDDLDGRLTFANRRFIDWFGLAGRDLTKVMIEECVAPEWRETLRNQHTRRMRGEAVSERFECEGIRADGRRMWLDAFITPVHEGGHIIGTQAVIRDITARKQAEQAAQSVLSQTALVVGEEYFRALALGLGQALGVSLVCIARIPVEGRLKPLAHFSDGALLELQEFDLPSGHPCGQVIARGKPVLIETGLGKSYPSGVCGRTDFQGYYGIPLRAGTPQVEGLLIMANVQPLQLEPLQLSLLNILAMRTEAEFVRERTEADKIQMQARLLQSQKYEALGTLAGGVAHDFNNILTGVINYTTLAKGDCPPSHPHIREFLEEVLNCGGRAKELVRQILLFSRSEDAERSPISLQHVVKEALSLIRSTLPSTIEIASEIEQNTSIMLANATQIHQVVMNLGINAAHAMRDQGGRLTVKLSERVVDPSMLGEFPDLKPGPHLHLEIKDTGCGMSSAIISRIFEPFFTTKQVGEGTGLGLAVVYSVVRSHYGAIGVSSQPGKGTTFQLYFPVHSGGGDLHGATQAELPIGRGEHVLLVDDEATIAKSVKLMLERIGYRVKTFTHPEEALAFFWAAPNDIDVVITDFQMPSMTGMDLARRFLARRPELPVFIASGFAGRNTAEKMHREGITAFLQKPIDLPELAQALRRVLDPST